MYLTYDEYTDMGGALDTTQFNNFEFEAEAVINWYTFNRLKHDTTIPPEVKRLMFYLISIAEQRAFLLTNSISGANGNVPATAIESQSNDGVSIKYNVMSAKDLMNSLKDSVKDKVDTYLQGVTNELGRELLFRGIYPGE